MGRSGADYNGAYQAPDVVAVGPGIDPTGAADSTSALQAKINAVPVGGRLFIPKGNYKISAPLTVPNSITIEGDSVASITGAISSGNSNDFPSSPYLAGSVIVQTAAATNGIQVTAAGIALTLRNLGVLFSGASVQNTNTGDGISARPTQVYGSGHDHGLAFFLIDNVQVYGHDGNHYALNLLNTGVGSIRDFRSYGGGGILMESDPGAINTGNVVVTHAYASVNNNGSAVGYGLKAGASTTPGILNLIVFVRPQANVASPATQPCYNDQLGAADVQFVRLIEPDFEGQASPHIGPNTQITGGNISFYTPWTTVRLGQNAGGSTTQQDTVAIGYQAAKALTSATRTTAVGYDALLTNSTATANTAIGYQAMMFSTSAQQGVAVGARALFNLTTGNSNVAVGHEAMQAATTATETTAIGYAALWSLTTGTDNTCIGDSAGYYSNGSTANAIVTGTGNTFVGFTCGSYSGDISQGTAVGKNAAVVANATALGFGATAQVPGSAAIGIDHTGASAAATIQDAIALGTANHQVQLKNNATGTGSAALGANCPATTVTAPYTWFRMLSNDGSTVYVPAWK